MFALTTHQEHIDQTLSSAAPTPCGLEHTSRIRFRGGAMRPLRDSLLVLEVWHACTKTRTQDDSMQR